MATTRRILIKSINKEFIANCIKRDYKIDRNIILDYESREIFLDRLNEAFIISDGYIENWTELDLDFKKSVDEHDIFLTKLSKEFRTTILFGYSQTTSGDTRFLALENGKIKCLYYEKSYFDPSHRIVLETNLGTKSKYEIDFKYTEVGQSIEGYKSLDFYDDIQAMFKDYGYVGAKRQILDENIYILNM